MMMTKPHLGDDEVVEGVVVRDDEVLLDVHELVAGDGPQLGELLPQRLQAARQELVDGVTCEMEPSVRLQASCNQRIAWAILGMPLMGLT